MEDYNKYFDDNRDSWNKRTVVHFDSDFYNNDDFVKNKSSLNEIELSEIGDVKGKSILHLQCHFGQDTLSFNNLGAEVVGVDLSDVAIDHANKLKDLTGLEGEFIQSNVYDLKDNLDRKFDIVFTSYGTIGWLPDLDKWADIVTHFLKPGGKFYIAEFHPVIWMFDEKFEKIEYPYLEGDVITEIQDRSYTDSKEKIDIKDHSWNHGLSKVVNALINKGLKIEFLNEHNYSPYDIFNDGVEVSEGKFMVKGNENMLPLVYSILATKS